MKGVRQPAVQMDCQDWCQVDGHQAINPSRGARDHHPPGRGCQKLRRMTRSGGPRLEGGGTTANRWERPPKLGDRAPDDRPKFG